MIWHGMTYWETANEDPGKSEFDQRALLVHCYLCTGPFFTKWCLMIHFGYGSYQYTCGAGHEETRIKQNRRQCTSSGAQVVSSESWTTLQIDEDKCSGKGHDIM